MTSVNSISGAAQTHKKCDKKKNAGQPNTANNTNTTTSSSKVPAPANTASKFDTSA